MSEVLKDSFMIYHSLDKKKLVSKIRKLEKRITEIEKKQAERYPNLIGRIGRMENSFPAIVDRLDRIEQSIVALVNRLKELERIPLNDPWRNGNE